jgi:hypothetical protein
MHNDRPHDAFQNGSTNIVIYEITMLDVPIEVLLKLIALEGPFYGWLAIRSLEESVKLIGGKYAS